jgi:hypothetical protein
VFLIRRLHEFHNKDQRESSKDAKGIVKILMSNAYVTKLIGKSRFLLKLGGAMVREIAAKSCGAQIKICSDQEQEKRLQDCIVTVAGNLASKQDAACIILEQLEEFRQMEVGAVD